MNFKNILNDIGEFGFGALDWAVSKAPFIFVITTPVITLIAFWQTTHK